MSPLSNLSGWFSSVQKDIIPALCKGSKEKKTNKRNKKKETWIEISEANKGGHIVHPISPNRTKTFMAKTF